MRPVELEIQQETPRSLEGLPGRPEVGELSPRGVRLGLLLLGMAIGPLLSLFILTTGRQQFGGMDGGVLSNAAWQLHLGYLPYTDVITAAPPFFLIGARMAFEVFGIRWLSFVWMTAVFSCITYTVHVLLLRRAGVGLLGALATATLTQLCTTVPGGFWWYNPTTEILACLFLTAFAGWPKGSRFDINVVIFGSLLLISKPNMAMPLIGLMFLVAIVHHGWCSAFGSFCCMALLGWTILEASNISPAAMIENYHWASGRAFSLRTMAILLWGNQRWEVEQTSRILIPGVFGLMILVVLSRRKRHGSDQKSAALLITGMFCTLVSMATNNSLNFTELPLAICGVTFWLTTRYRWVRPAGLELAAMLAIAITGTALAANASLVAKERTLIMEVGPHLFFERESPVEVTTQSFFAGMEGSGPLARLLNDLNALFAPCSRCSDRDGRVFIGPRIDFAYAAYGIKPPRGLPLWWEAFHDSNSAISRAMVERFRQQHFQLVVFLKGDFTFLPDSLVSYLKSEYDVSTTQTLTIFKSKRAALAPTEGTI